MSLTRIDKKYWIWIPALLSVILLVVFSQPIKQTYSLSKDYLKRLKGSGQISFLNRSGLDSNNFEKSQKPEFTQQDRPTQKVLAKLSGVLGEVRLKRAFSATWNQIYVGVDLYEGDQVFGGSLSTGKITYTSNGSTLAISGYSLLRISELPPQKTEYPRQTNTNMSYTPPQGTSEFGYLLKSVGAQAPKLYDKDIGELRSRSKVKDKIVILGPVGNLMLIAKSYPCPLAVRLDRIWDQTRLWAYLWDQNQPGAAPIWTGQSNGSFSKILIPRPGVYSMVIKSEDERAESQIMEIAASLRVENQFPILGLEKDLHKNLTVVYQ